MSKRKALGRGLNALITMDDNETDGSSYISEIALTKIKPNPDQPREDFDDETMEELATSIQKIGVIQPITLRELENGEYQIIAGERRYRASIMAKLSTIPAYVKTVEDEDVMEMALIENIQREDLNAIDTGLAYRRLLDEFNLTVEELGKRIGKSSPVIVNTMRLLSLPEEIRQGLIKGLITEGHAKIIVGLVGEAKQMELYHKIIANKMTVANTAIETRKMGGTKKARIVLDSDDEERQARLKDFFNSPVTLKRKDWGGQIIIDFKDDESLAAIMEKIK